ncbi:tRNA (adenosine(37)-N6)-threonylcarbamoyltransferase complex dimerization subunit type 1 TsaB, partial [Lysinibacillus sp. OL1_EC]|nr:tRNA (adenosine(37)-N6)-threonylcarbamoyltransferase complex dimerization subunit type 1 TsaB [Lysinibacillus sp. OL1_EC]
RRGQLYTGLYKFSQGMLECVIEDVNLPAEEWADTLCKYDGKILFVGHDVVIHQEVLKSKLGDQAVLADMTSHNPRPSELIRLGMDRSDDHVHGLVPNYIRLAEAEAKWREAQK